MLAWDMHNNVVGLKGDGKRKMKNSNKTTYGYFTVYHVRVPNNHFSMYSIAYGLVYSIWI